MKKALLLIVALVALGLMQLAYASQEEFCAGFTEGYKSIKGDMALVPLCPLAPSPRWGPRIFAKA